MATFPGTGNADTLIGTNASDVFLGSAGNDSIVGTTFPNSFNTLDYSAFTFANPINVSFTGTTSGTVGKAGIGGTDSFTGINSIRGSQGTDSIAGFGGATLFTALWGGDGADTINGGANNNVRVDYFGAPTGVSIDLAAGTAADGFGDIDRLINVRRVRGTEFADTIVGSSATEFFDGSQGNDTFNGGGGFDQLDYSTGIITGPINATFSSSAYSGTVVKSGLLGADTFAGIEFLGGTAGADTLIGSNDATSNLPFAITLAGRGGADFIDGRKSQLNQVTYSNSPGAVTIVLQTVVDGSGNWTGTANDGFGATDTLRNVNRVQGSPLNDTITGSAVGDRFDASSGNDVYFGGGGNNIADYGNQGASFPINVTVFASQTGLFGYGVATVVKGPGRGTDSLNGVNQIRGTAGNDVLTGFDHVYTWNTIVLRGGAGADTIDGASDSGNRADYASSTSAATIDLTVGTAVDGLGSTDRLINVRSVASSSNNDTITGSAFDDSIQVQAGGSQFVDGRGGRNAISYNGNDGVTLDLGDALAAPGGFGGWQGSIVKTAGTATIWNFNTATGGTGNDTLFGTPEDDTLSGGPGSNVLNGRGGTNTASYRSWTGPLPTQGAVIDLSTGTATNSWGGTDTFINIQNALGTQFADTITGGDLGATYSVISGEGGNDLLQAPNLSALVMASYSSSLSRVVVNLSTGLTSDDGWFGGADTLVGIRGVRGSGFNDDITGGASDDSLEGGNGNDFLRGREGADTLSGGGGDDFLIGGSGNDRLDGGSGSDRADYRAAPGGIVVDMALGLALQDGHGGADTLVGIERVIGSDHNDSLLGSSAADDFTGGLGDDTFDGAGGFDVVWFGRAPSPVLVDLAAGTATGEGADTLISIEGAVGSPFADDLRGDANGNYFRGDADATMAGAADTIDGRDGLDYLDYREDPAGIRANLAIGQVIDGRGFTDRLISIERIGGTAFADTLLGDGEDNILDGRAGNDSIDGGDGDDTLAGGNGIDTIIGGAGFDQISLGFVAGATPLPTRGAVANLATGVIADDGFGNAELLGPGSSIEALAGTSFGDTLTGADLPGGEVSILAGEGGNDLLVAPTFNALVMASYATSAAAVDVDLDAGEAFSDGFGGMDTLIGIRGVRGSAFADLLAGTDLADTLQGADGNDTLVAGDGADTVAGGNGDDVIEAGGGADTLSGGAGADRFGLTPIEALPGAPQRSVLGAMVVITDFSQAEGDKLVIGAGDGLYLGQWTEMPIVFGGSLAGVAAPTAGLGLPGVSDSLVSHTAFWLPDLAGGGWVVVDVDQDGVLGALDFVARLDGPIGLTITAADFTAGTFGTVAPLGSALGEAIGGTIGSDLLFGLGGDDTLTGLGGNDALQGGAGADWLFGGAGDDSYQVDTQADLIFENPGEGVDVAVATTGFYLYANIENLILAAGAGAIFGVGNELANGIAGNDSPNTIISWDGNDTIYGLGGNDILYSVADNDEMDGGAGVDFLAGGDGNDTLTGGLDPDQVFGEAGDDSITGGPDFVFDFLVGGDGADTLDGRSGFGDFDYLYGGDGSDFFMVDTPDDLVFEFAAGGADTVQADIVGAGYYLYAEIEDLVLLGATPFGVGNNLGNRLTGSATQNWLLGGAGADTLNGKGGNDVLFGEDGADIFVFERGTGGDVIGDFVSGLDRLVLSGLGFADIAAVQAAFFTDGVSGAINLGQGDFVVLNGVTSIAPIDIVLI